MIRTYRYPLRPTAAQAATLESWRIACQQLYNGALQERRDAWKRAGVSISRYDQQKSLTILRRDDAEWRAVPVEVARSSLARIERSFAAFFRRCKAGEKPGFPRFKSRARYGSIGLGSAGQGKVRVENGIVIVPRLGPVKFHEYRPIKGAIKNVIVKRDISGWSAYFQCDIGDAPAKVEPQTSVGIDLGLTSLAVLSTGEIIDNPRHLADAQGRIAHLQRELARKERGSARRHKARLRLAKAHQRVQNQRLDHARKVAASLVQRFDLVAHEDLQIARMARGVLSKSIHDASWGILLRCLSDKAESAGRHLVAVDPRGTTIDCSGCGKAVPKALDQRIHRCDCGLVLGRDHNAAINVLARGLRVRGGRTAPDEARSFARDEADVGTGPEPEAGVS